MSAEGAAVVAAADHGRAARRRLAAVHRGRPGLSCCSAAPSSPPPSAPSSSWPGCPSPANPALRLLPPLLPLALLVLTGLGSGACQEWLRARAERRKPTPFAGCLAAAFRRGLPHAAARALALVGPLLGLGVWLSTVSLTEKPGGTADPGLLLGASSSPPWRACPACCSGRSPRRFTPFWHPGRIVL